MKRLYDHVRTGSNSELPSADPTLQKRRKQSGELFGDEDEEFQIASQANRIQMWWNTWSSKNTTTHLRRRDVFDIFGRIVHKLTLVQPSSAASERVFSILVRMYGKQQVPCLEDYKESGVIMSYNKRST